MTEEAPPPQTFSSADRIRQLNDIDRVRTMKLIIVNRYIDVAALTDTMLPGCRSAH